MPKPRKGKQNNEDVSNNNASLEEPSTSSQPPRRSSRRKPSPFRGFDGEVDQKKLIALKRVLQDKNDGNELLPDKNTSEAVPKKKVKQPENCKSKQVKPEKNPKDKKKRNYTAKSSLLEEFSMNVIKSPLKKKETKNCSAENFKSEAFLGAESKLGNVVNILDRLQRGEFKQSVIDELSEQVAFKNFRWFKVFGKIEISDLRVTALAWHPTNSSVFVVGGKGGSLMLYKKYEAALSFHGVGPGGTMENIRFRPGKDLEVFTASVDGTIALYNFENFIRKSLIESEDPYRVWFCGVDVHPGGKCVYGGDSSGNLGIHYLDNGRTDYAKRNVQKYKLHTSKIRHLEFCPRDPNIFVTSSLDKTVKVWDIRKLDGKNSCLETLHHTTGVSAAKFSRTDGCRLLTTDLCSELRVYKLPSWTLEHEIVHPHRHFQHLTVIRASWLPTADLFVAGRYPDPKFADTYDDLRSVDVFSASSGKLQLELTNTGRLITSLAEVNATGCGLLSTSGRTVYFWKQSSSSRHGE